MGRASRPCPSVLSLQVLLALAFSFSRLRYSYSAERAVICIPELRPLIAYCGYDRCRCSKTFEHCQMVFLEGTFQSENRAWNAFCTAAMLVVRMKVWTINTRCSVES